MINPSHRLLLIRLFDRLRKELSLPLGIGEYQLLLQALEQQQGMTDAQSLLRLCETIWINNREDREVLKEMLQELMAEEVKLIEAMERKKAAEEKRRRDIEEASRRAEEEEKNKQEKQKEGDQEIKNQGTDPKADPKEEELSRKDRQIPSDQEEEVGVVLHVPIDEQAEGHTSEEETEAFILTDTYLPISIREMKQIWRNLRHFASGGESEEINIPATVKAFARDGIVLDPIFQSDRINKIQLMLLVDQDRSMVGFHRLTRSLVEAAKEGGGHSHASVYYFKQCPEDHLYTMSNHLQHEALGRIYSQTSPLHTVVMILSDAGAASGEYSTERIAQTQLFLNRLKQHVARVSWLNPMPRHRWAGTSAFLIADMVPMFELMSERRLAKSGQAGIQVDHRKGLEQAVSILQGKKI
ncbi:MAG: hypothetical protein AAF587_37065 [Bacteroidota bacterium]